MDLRPALSGKKVSDGGLVGEKGESRKHPGNKEGLGLVAGIGEAASRRRGCLSAVDVGEEPVESSEPCRQWRRRRPQNPRATGKAAGVLLREEEGGGWPKGEGPPGVKGTDQGRGWIWPPPWP